MTALNKCPLVQAFSVKEPGDKLSIRDFVFTPCGVHERGILSTVQAYDDKY